MPVKEKKTSKSSSSAKRSYRTSTASKAKSVASVKLDGVYSSGDKVYHADHSDKVGVAREVVGGWVRVAWDNGEVQDVLLKDVKHR